MNDYKLSDKLKYWLDKQLSKGTASIIKLLSLCVITIVILVSVMIVLFKLRDGFVEAFWDSLATIVNAWMPSSEDGEAGYIVLNTITAIIGLFFTSILIGVISSGIEAKLDSIRNGNSIVIEKDHTVILGYTLGEHGLLNQLIIATGDKKRCIVIYTDIEKAEIEQDLHNNVEIPKNIEVICRHGDITNINDLRYCSIDKAKVVIINALNDNVRIKALLAASMLKKEYPECSANIIACVSDDEHLLPKNKIRDDNIIMLKTDDIMAKMIAHTATEPGLSVAFKELLNFEGNELYFEQDERFYGKSVFELAIYIDKATLVGVKHNGKVKLNPDRNTVIQEGDEVLLFEEDESTYEVNEIELKKITDKEFRKSAKEAKGTLFIFGNNVLLETIIRELPSDIKDIVLVHHGEDQPAYDKDLIKRKNLTVFKGDYKKNLDKIASKAGHIVILADRTMDEEDSDISNILLLLKLMDLKEVNDYSYNVTIELNMENSYNVAMKDDEIDYIVSSNIASLVLAQMSENTELEGVFEELLSNKGNELYSKPLKPFNLSTKHDYSFGALKQIALTYGYTLVGYSHNDQMILNTDLEERITFNSNDRLIVLGRE
ncbi:MAG: hypothetical protein J5365_07020 [Erysipelotrichaceae bacterium]|nr:hypothetical protein [Erysipelotrichaceae bacterium]